MNNSEKINIICSIAGIIISIITIIMSFVFEKRQRQNEKNQIKKDKNRYNLSIESQAKTFIQKFSDSNEIQLISLAIIADNYNPLFPYRRQFYKEWCSLNSDVKKTVLKQLNIDTPLVITNDNLYIFSCNKLKEMTNKEFYNNLFYDGAKYLERSLTNHKNKIIPNNDIGYTKGLLGNCKKTYKDAITDILAYGETSYFSDKEQISETEIKKVENANLGDFYNGKEITASYLCCLVMQYYPIYYSKNNCIIKNVGYIEDYFAFNSDDEYMEDAFLQALFAINFYKKECDINES